jgi:hypothetical protein
MPLLIRQARSCSHSPTPSCVLLAVTCRRLFPNTGSVWDAGWPASGAHVLVVRTCYRHCTSVSPHIQHNIIRTSYCIHCPPFLPHLSVTHRRSHPLTHPSRLSNHSQSPRAAAATGDDRGNMLSKFESKSNRVKGDHSPRLSLSPTRHSHSIPSHTLMYIPPWATWQPCRTPFRFFSARVRSLGSDLL